MTTHKSTVLALLMLAPAGSAQAQQVAAADGTYYNTSAISHWTSGSEMTNMEVVVCRTSGCVNKLWGDLSNGAFGVQEAGSFRLSVGANTDTYLGTWRFDMWGSADLKSIQFNGRGGNTIFDRSLPFFGSPGSSLGLDAFALNQCVARTNGINCVNFHNTQVTYSNKVSVNNVFYGDEYESVLFDFANVGLSGPDAFDGFDSDFTTRCTTRRQQTTCSDVGFNFFLDSDNATLDALVTETSVVPEPSTYALMSIGLMLVGGAARRRRRITV